ncbi:DELTA-stichotoxin-Hcr4a-like [Arapaima gigas]
MAGLGSGATLVNELVQQYHCAPDRCVSIVMSNCSKNHTLVNPQVYTFSGYCYNPPQPTVRPGVTEICLFGKTIGCATGAVGVLTYDVTDRQNSNQARLAIMFSVPFDYNHFENWFALGFFDKNRPCDESLYKHMYYETGKFTRGKSVGSEIKYCEEEERFTLKGTMSALGRSVMKVEFWDGCCTVI